MVKVLFERFMKTLKGLACQRARLEGSMDEGWLVQDSLVFTSKLLSSTDPRKPQLWCFDLDERVSREDPQKAWCMKKKKYRYAREGLEILYPELACNEKVDCKL